MNITAFTALVAEKMEGILRGEMHEEVQVNPMEIMKLNDQSLHGISIEKGDEPSPTYYLNEMFMAFESGADLERMIRELADAYLDARTCWPLPAEELPDMTYQTIRRRVGLRLVGKAYNNKFLQTVPYRDVGFGYALICEVQMKASDGGLFSTTVTNEMVERYGYHMDRLFDTAMDNAWKSNAASLRGTHELMGELTGARPDGPEDETCYVLSTDRQRFGAAALFYPGTTAMIARVLDEDYYAVPSSLHEFIIIPESCVQDPSLLCKLVQEANTIIVGPDEVLSDNVLKYSRSTSSLSLISPDEEGPLLEVRDYTVTHPAWLAI